MPRGLGLGLLGAGLATLVGAGALVPRALAEMEVFQVQGIRLEGARFLTLEAALGTLVLPEEASVWDDPEPWLGPLLEHPLVDDVDVRRELPDSLVLYVTENQPVALVPTPTLEPVDADGRRLPIDPSHHTLDLPVLRVGGGASEGFDPGRVRLLALELERLSAADGGFASKLSELEWAGRGDAVARWGEPDLAIQFRIPLPVGRLRQALAVLGDATTRFPDRRPRAVDLRYAEQVVIRF